MPVTSPDGGYTHPSVWSVTDPAHQLAAWLPSRWRDRANYGYLVPHENATVVMEGADGYPLLTYRTDSGGTVIHVNHDMSYQTYSIHPNALQVTVNAVEFASGIAPADCNDNGVPDECTCEGDGDMTGNGTVNLEDLGQFLDCLHGPHAGVDPTCRAADMDCDQDVDLEDVAAFCAAF